jgi:hypothetical protein
MFSMRAGAVEQVIVTGHKPTADACRKIAEAKYTQWAQPRLSRVQTETFADRSQKTIQKIYTENTVYLGHGSIWNTMQLFTAQRRVESPEAVARNMDLADCAKGDAADENGHAATIYDYRVGADNNSASVRTWISDETVCRCAKKCRNPLGKHPYRCRYPQFMRTDRMYISPSLPSLRRLHGWDGPMRWSGKFEWNQANGGSPPNR